MDFISIHTFQNLGIAIIHSLWQIGLITFVYFYFILARKKLSINKKYTTGLASFVIMLVIFIITFQFVENQHYNQTQESSLNSVLNTSNQWQLSNQQGKDIADVQDNSRLFVFNSYKLKTILNQVAGVVGIVWILGLFFFGIRKTLAYFNLKGLKNNKYNVRSTKWEKTLKEIAIKLNLKKHVDILFSPFVNSPVSFGFLKPVILFPLRLTTGLSSEEIKCILIHELAHNLRNDYLYNIFQNAIEVLFFYHPGVWWISKNIRTQREIICDKIVLDNKISEKKYANTLIKLAELQIFDSNLAVAAKRSNKELFTRIKYIVNKPDNSRKRKGNPLLVVGVVLMLIVSGFAFKGNEKTFKLPDLGTDIEKILSPYNGAFAFYDLKKQVYYTSNDSLCNTRYPAYSTFKIASSLIALDLGIASDESYTIQYDSLKYPIPGWMKKDALLKNWKQDHSLKSALYYSVNWYFNELGERIGNDNMVKYMKRLAYGNQVVSTGSEQAWYNGQLKTSANEQVEFLKNLLNKKCKDISAKAQLITKNTIPGEKESNYSLYGKTGTGEITDDRFIGWYVGFLETKNNSYVYALNVFADDTDKISWKKRQEMVKTIFTNLGLIEK